jgi:hypothetical protein
MTQPSGTQAAARAAIVATALDYYEGWFTGDAERMRRALHPLLVKRAVDADDDESGVETLSAQQMVDDTAAGLGRRANLDELAINVHVDHQTGSIATATVTSTVYVDYLQLVEVDGAWRILNALWARV